MTNKFTPGPWRIDEPLELAAFGISTYDQKDGQLICIADIHDLDNLKGEVNFAAAYNATLIAAAPDLLSALRWILEEKIDYMTLNNLGDPLAQQTSIRAMLAIEKATGDKK